MSSQSMELKVQESGWKQEVTFIPKSVMPVTKDLQPNR